MKKERRKNFDYDLTTSSGRYWARKRGIDVPYPPRKRKPFYDWVNKTDYCWEWIGSKDTKGYGIWHYKGKLNRCHRIVWMEAHGEITSDVVIMHKCDNPACVRLEHLEAGTQRQNMEDCYKKLRHTVGEQHPNSKITKEIALEIINSKKAAKKIGRVEHSLEIKRLADKYSLSVSHVTAIGNTKWKFLLSETNRIWRECE